MKEIIDFLEKRNISSEFSSSESGSFIHINDGVELAVPVNNETTLEEFLGLWKCMKKDHILRMIDYHEKMVVSFKQLLNTESQRNTSKIVDINKVANSKTIKSIVQNTIRL